MRNKNKIVGLLILILVIAGGFLFLTELVQAQAPLDTGLEEVGGQTGLGNEDPRIIIARVLRIFLGFLGVVALAIVLYGGFLYMTSGGAETAVEKAKKWIINGMIGLAIIISAFSITSFVINRLGDATGATNSTEDGTGGTGGDGGNGGTVGFSVGMSPRGANRPVNSVVQITFPSGRTALPEGEYQNAKTNIKLFEIVTEGETETEVPVEGDYTVTDRKVIFATNDTCPEGCAATSCLQPDKNYRIKVLELQDQNGNLVACPNRLQGYCQQVDFSTSNSCDTTSPTVSLTPSPRQVRLGFQEDFTVDAADASGLAAVEFCPTKQTAQDSLCQEIIFEDASPLTYNSILSSVTSGFDLGWHTGEVSVGDVSGNQASATGRYLVASDNCFDADGDFDCTLPECEVDDCNECTGDDCVYNCVPDDCTEINGVEQCSTTCSNWPYPLITNISPASSPINGFITLFGRNFGVFAQEARVLINGVEAAPLCGRDSWDERQVVVTVPDTTTGPVQIFNNQGSWYNTADPNAPGWNRDLEIVANGSNMIGLCSVRNAATQERFGLPGNQLILTGRNFGSDGGVYFNGDEISAGNWLDDVISDVQVPFIGAGRKTVQVGRDEFYSNPVDFSVSESESQITIESITPTAAAPGQIITIRGNNFGVGGTVNFIRDNTRTPALTTCVNNWSNDSIQITIPELATASYTLEIVNNAGSATVPYSVDDSLTVTPGICSVTPDNGPPGTTITIQGVGFGEQKGRIKFASAAEGVPAIVEGFNLQSAEWSNTEISGVTVPPDARSGDMVVEAAGVNSTPVTFSVGRCTTSSCGAGEVCCQNSYCTEAQFCQAQATNCEFGWYFSTGNIPRVPRVINRECSLGIFDESPSPKANGQNACPNGLISFTFNMEMDTESLVDANRVEVRSCLTAGSECNLDLCDDSNCAVEEYDFVAQGTDGSGRTLLDEALVSNYDNTRVTQINLVNYDVAPNTWYAVMVKAGIRNVSAVGDEVQELLNDYTWKFKTAEADCAIDSVVVNPGEGVLTDVTESQKFAVSGQASNCGIIDVSNETWNWLVTRYGDRISRLFVAGSRSDVAYFAANPEAVVVETPPGDPGVVQTNGMVSSQPLQDEADLAVTLAEPRVVDFWPNCGAACVNAELGALFNTYFPYEALRDNTAAVGLYECDNADCISVASKVNMLADYQAGEIDCDSTTGVSTLTNYGEVCNRLRISPTPVLSPAKYYRLVISGQLTSISDKTLTGLNFNTRANVGTCGNGVIETDAGEQCEAICLNSQSNAVCVSGTANCVCALSNNPYCSNDCRLVGFSRCTNGGTGCCGDGDIDTYLGSAQLQEQCEVDECTKAGKVTFVGSLGVTPLEVCNEYFNDNKNKPNILSTACQCGQPRECESSTCASYCLEDINKKCTTDSLTCTCIEPKVCQEDTTKYCTENQSACDCQPQRACAENITQACTGSSAGCTCQDVGRFQLAPEEACFEADAVKGECQILTYCSGTTNQCTASSPACTCVDLNTTTAECPQEKDLVCPETCSLSERQECDYGDAGCSCSFPDNCTNCVLTDQTITSPSTFDSFSFVFKTREDGGFCRPERVDVSPSSYLSTMAGEQAVFSATPFSAPDTCSANGQRLSAKHYTWDWEEMTGEAVYYTRRVDLASVSASAAAADKLIAMYETTYSPQRAVACTENCLNQGSVTFRAVCGNDVIEAGEECDGEAFCSNKCLRLGSPLCFGGNSSACCGNRTVDPTEDCDDGNGNSGDGCSRECFNEGAQSAGFVCGNGAKELGEDDDFGSSKLNTLFGLDNNCLYKGSSGYVGPVCGNGLVDSGEECEPVTNECVMPVRNADGSVQKNSQGEVVTVLCQPGTDYCVCPAFESVTCSNKCLIKPFDTCTELQDTVSCCGNGLTESFNGYTEECEYTCTNNSTGENCAGRLDEGNCTCRPAAGCTSGCLNGGSNDANASFCGNGIVEPGEDRICEQTEAGVTVTNYGAPYSMATVLGHLPAGQNQQTAKIRGTLTNNVSYLENSTEQGQSINDESLLTYIYSGLGGPTPPECDPNNPPRATLISPDGTLTCPNAVITVRYDYLMTELHKGGGKINKFVELRYRADQCGGSLSWLGRLRDWTGEFFGLKAQAAEWCVENQNNYAVVAQKVQIGKNLVTQIYIATKGALRVTDYEVVLKNVKNNCSMIIPDQEFRFNVGSDYCHFDSVGIEPAVKNVTQRDEIWNIRHLAKSGNTEIQPISGHYAWSWGAWEIEDRDIVSITDVVDSNEDVAMAKNKNGDSDIEMTAEITFDQYFGEVKSERTGSGLVSAFICENPWSWDDGSDGRNILLRYCRDREQINNRMDDLPLLRVVTSQIGAEENGLQRQYLLIRSDEIINSVNTNDFSDDVISLRIYENPANLSAAEWYRQQVPQAGQSVSEVKVFCSHDARYDTDDCYYGVKDGNTVYVSAGNLIGSGSSASVSNYIYVLGYNLGANSRTINMFSQLVENMGFNINVSSSDVQFAIRRDIQRINNIVGLRQYLTDYYTQKIDLPRLEGGTYRRGESYSVWPSWQAELGNILGKQLALDPINQMARYEPSTNATFVGVSCGSNGKKCLLAEHQCFDYQGQAKCSVCSQGADVNNCYDPDTLQIEMVFPIGTSPVSLFNYAYSYLYQGFNEARITFRTEAESYNYYTINNKPGFNFVIE
ncbi:TPA: hypothetical protein DF272_04915 [Candidatus Falkowbacteria bacterium]|nr:hypothetical protein [Candidatus Falkowbacteria bacterium]